METAEEFANRLESECVYGIKYEESFHPDEAVKLIKARDAAVALAAKLALLDELIALDDGSEDTMPVYGAVAILRTKYTQPTQSQEGEG